MKDAMAIRHHLRTLLRHAPAQYPLQIYIKPNYHRAKDPAPSLRPAPWSNPQSFIITLIGIIERNHIESRVV